MLLIAQGNCESCGRPFNIKDDVRQSSREKPLMPPLNRV